MSAPAAPGDSLLVTVPPVKSTLRDLKNHVGTEVLISGWCRSRRTAGKRLCFVALDDGTTTEPMQLVLEKAAANKAAIHDNDAFERAFTQASMLGVPMQVCGEVGHAPKGALEVRVRQVMYLGTVDAAEYPLSKTAIPLEVLRQYPQYRMRTATFAAVARIRNRMMMATHAFFQERQFCHVNPPQITRNDCEGGGEAFVLFTSAEAESQSQATAKLKVESDNARAMAHTASNVFPSDASDADLPTSSTLVTDDPSVATSYFGTKACLTVSSQLHLEAMCHSLGRVYCYQNAFRADDSQTPRHLSEFIMLEAEEAFADMDDMLDTVQAYIKSVLFDVLASCASDLAAMETMRAVGLVAKLERAHTCPFVRMTYDEAIERLMAVHATALSADKQLHQPFEVAPFWGLDLGSEHERYLVKHVADGMPLFLTHFPAKIKSFYMLPSNDKQFGSRRHDGNSTDSKGATVDSFDLLLPDIGEVAGGSARIYDADLLTQRVHERGMSIESIQWYIDLRRNGGGVCTSGFGIGIARLLMFLTGLDNIRDTQEFPVQRKRLAF